MILIWKRFGHLSVMGLCLAMVLHTVSAQDPVPLDPSGPSAEEIEKAQADYAAVWAAEFANLEFSELNTVYLADLDAADESLFAPETMAGIFATQIVSEWTDVELAAATSPIDVLFLHVSAVATADRNWIRQAYRDGTLIIGLSIPFEKLMELIGDACIENENWWIPDVAEDWIIYPIYWSGTDTPENKVVLDRENLEICKDDLSRTFPNSVWHGSYATGIHPEILAEQLDYLGTRLKGSFIDRKLSDGIDVPSRTARQFNSEN